MGKYFIDISINSQKELRLHYNSGDRITLKRIERIFEELAYHPFQGIGKPEALKYKLSGYWSRELNKKDRLIYRVDENAKSVFIVSARGHYGDK
jgi:toxin YoeB